MFSRAPAAAVRFRPARPSFCLTAAVLTFAAAPAVADVVVLRGGGEVRGEFVGDPRQGDAIAVRTRSGAAVTVPRADVRDWAYRTPEREAFEARFDRTAPPAGDEEGEGLTDSALAAAWWDLAEWALARRLRGERERALLKVIEAQPRHEPARKALGHVRDDGEWMSRQEWRDRRGLVLYDNRAVSPEERDLLARADAADEASRGWYRDVRRWRKALSERDRARAGEAKAELERIDDPHAAEALQKYFADDRDPALRTFYVRVLNRLPGDAPVPALADQAMRDVDATVRREAVAALTPPDRREAAQPLLREGLRSEENLTVRRTASALAEVGDARAVPDLIKSLVTTHYYKVAVPDNNGASAARGTGGLTGRGSSLGGGAGGAPLPPGVELGLRTGQYPAGVNIIPQRRIGPTRQVTVKVEHTNPEALRALQALVNRLPGADGAVPPPDAYDESAWTAWWALNRGGLGG